MSATPAYQTDQHTEFKVHLIRRGLSQRKLARELGITVQYLNDVVRGRRKAHQVRVRLICEFGIPAELVEYRPEESQAA